MTDERYKELMEDKDDKLTNEEINEGWFFCDDCDYLLTTKENCCLNRVGNLDYDKPIIL